MAQARAVLIPKMVQPIPRALTVQPLVARPVTPPITRAEMLIMARLVLVPTPKPLTLLAARREPQEPRTLTHPPTAKIPLDQRRGLPTVMPNLILEGGTEGLDVLFPEVLVMT